MDIAVVILGVLAQAAAQWFVAHRPESTWVTIGSLFAVLVPLTVLTGAIDARVTLASLASGVVAGGLLYGATQLFLVIVEAWGTFQQDVGRLYSQRGALPLGTEIAVGAYVATGEELFWRGLVIAVLTPTMGVAGAAGLSLLLYVGTSAVSASRPVTAAAIVGGGAWTWLAVWSPGGLAAAVACHVAWTVLMIAFPRAGAETPHVDSAS